MVPTGKDVTDAGHCRVSSDEMQGKRAGLQSWSKAAIDGTFEPQSLRTPRRTDALKLETQKPHKLDGDENTGSNS